MLNGNAHVLTRLVIELRRKGCMNKVTLNGKPVDMQKCFGTTSDHIRGIPAIECRQVKATPVKRKPVSRKVTVSYDMDILRERVKARVQSVK